MTIEGLDVDVKSAPRSMVHARVNEVVASSDADVFMQWADDLFCLTPLWDDMIAHAIKQVPAFSWQEVQDPKNHTAIVISKEWAKATGRFYPEYFPFWFADTWMKEVFCYLYGHDMPIVNQLRFSHKRQKTTNMHDLAFWFRFFTYTRSERINEAKKIAAACGREWTEYPEITQIFERADALQLEKVPQYELAFGGNGIPSASYLKAKEKAEQMMSVESVFAEAT